MTVPVRAVSSLLVAVLVLAPSATTWAQAHDPAPPEPPRWFLAGDAGLGGGRFRTGYGWVEPLDWLVWQSGLAAGAGVGLTLVIEDVLGNGAQLGTVHRGEASCVLFGPRVDVRFF